MEGNRALLHAQLHAGESPGELLQGDLQVEPGHVGAGAPVRAGPERDMPIANPVEVELVGPGELLVVPVGRSPVDEDLFSRRYLAATDLGISHRRTGDGDEGALEPKQFLDCLGYELWAAAQQFRYRRLAAEADHEVPQRPGCCIQAAENQQGDGPQNLRLGDGPPFDVGVQYGVDDVAPRRLPSAILDELHYPLVHGYPAGPGIGAGGHRSAGREVVDLGHLVGWGVKHELEEGGTRERPGELGHEVTPTGLYEGVDQAAHQIPDGSLVAGDRGRREVGVDQPLEGPLQWRIEVLGDGGDDHIGPRDRDPVGRAEGSPILGDPEHVLVPGHHPEAAVLVAVGDRALLSHAGEGRVEVGAQRGRQMVEVG